MATESDNVNSGALVTLLFVGTFAMLGIALVVTALVRTETTEEAEKKDIGADRPYRDLVAEQTAKMAAPAAYLDRGKGSVSLPIDRAMELVVSGLTKDPNSATPPAPIGGAGGAGGASGAGGTGGTAATGTGGTGAAVGGTNSGGMPANPTAPTDSAAVEVAKPADGSKDQGQGKPTEKEKPGGKGNQPEKKAAPPKVAPQPVPAAPAPAAPAPAAPAPAAPAP